MVTVKAVHIMWAHVSFAQILDFEVLFLFDFCITDYLLHIKGEVSEEKCVCCSLVFYFLMPKDYKKHLSALCLKPF